MIRQVRHMLELVRFSHTLFALPFAVLAAVMAWSENAHASPPVAWRWTDLVGILICMATARSAAMAFNRLADERIDAANPRTRGRHLPAGLLSRMSVVLFAAACSAGFIAATLLFLPNRLPLYLSLPVLAFLLAYSFTKRFTALSHFWLGAALMLAPMSAWIAIRGAAVVRDPRDLLPAVVLGGAVLLWVAGFDMIYACQDVDFDRQQALKSMPVRLGVRGALRLAAACHAGTVVLLGALPLVYNRFGWVYWTGVAAVAALLVYEHRLVRPDDLTRVNRAFFNVNAVISIGLLAVATADLMIR
jgi:4-hydroxybenzoate polyprenyltransferase